MLLAKSLPLIVTALSALASEPGDRHPDFNCVYPPDVFLHASKGDRMIEVITFLF